MRKSTMKTILIIIAVVLGACLLIGGISYLGQRTNGFAKPITSEVITSKLRNEKNLFDVEDYTIAKTVNPGTGVTVVTAKDGSMTVNGKLPATENELVLEVGTVELAKGTYKFTTGWNTGLYTAYMKVVIDGTAYNADFGQTIELDAAETGTVYLVIEPNVEFDNVHLYPVINEGTEAVTFYK